MTYYLSLRRWPLKIKIGFSEKSRATLKLNDVINFMRNPIFVVPRKIVMVLMLICFLFAGFVVEPWAWFKGMMYEVYEQIRYGGVSVEPTSFPFDASRKGSVLRAKFHVNTYRNYLFTLEFFHGGDQNNEFRKLVEAEFALYLTDSIVSGSPVKISRHYFMEKKEFASRHEEEEAESDAGKKYGQAVWLAKASNGKHPEYKNKYSKFVWAALDKKGFIPVSIKIFKIDNQGNASLISDETHDTLGMFTQGTGTYVRQITVEALPPGDYEVQVEALRDSPLFFDTPIHFGIAYRPKMLPIVE